MDILTIIKDTKYDLSLFEKDYIEDFNKSIFEKKGKPYVTCLVRKKEIKLTPEEVVRQLFLMVLMRKYNYPTNRILVEYDFSKGREKKRADIVVLEKNRENTPYIIVELKKPKLKDGKDQLKSYCNWTGAPIGVWTNGRQISYYHRTDPNYFEDISDIPNVNQKLSDIVGNYWKYEDLIKKDKLVNERKSLKDLILEMEDEVLANAGVDVFEELFKLIFIKLHDEKESGRKPSRNLQFRNYGDTNDELKERIQSLFEEAIKKYPGIFPEGDKIGLTASHLSVCLSSLQDVKLFNSNLEVVDDAFEYLISKSRKAEKGQYFTPRYVIEMCVKMLNPQEGEKMIDTAAGSCGFPVHTIFYVWRKIFNRLGKSESDLFTIDEKPAECKDYVEENVFAIDFDETTVRVARMLNSIAGDGNTNVLWLNTLEYEKWDEKSKEEEWMEKYFDGWKRLKGLRQEKNSNRDFNFDIVMANPPFAGEVKESPILSRYEIATNIKYKKLNSVPQGVESIKCNEITPNFADALVNGEGAVYETSDDLIKRAEFKESTSKSRDVLFIERNIDFLKPGGRMAIVLPQGHFNNASDKYIRDYIASRCRILAVVGLHTNVFKPHTPTKTSVLIVQKWDNELCPKLDDYNIFFATMQKPSKDNRGDKKYRMQSIIRYMENHQWIDYPEEDFIAKYGSINAASIYIPYAMYKLYAEQLKENDDNFLMNIDGKINGFEYEKLDDKAKNNYVKIKFPIQEKRPLLDHHGHLIVEHDLFNHDNLTEDGIVEAFIEFAKREHLSFFAEAPLIK